MTPAEISLYHLLPLIGVRSLDPEADANNANRLAANAQDISHCALAITQALQEIFALGPVDVSEQRYSGVLRLPVGVTFSATQFSTTISGFSGWQDWMAGCTIQGTDGEDNELLSAAQLQRPFLNTSGSAQGTVYADALLLPSWVKNTIDPVSTPVIYQLRSAANREEFRFYNSPYVGDPRAHMAGTNYYVSRNKTVGDPCVYFVEPRYNEVTGQQDNFMRFNPMPGQATPVNFTVRRKPPAVASSDILALSTFTIVGTDAAGNYGNTNISANGQPIYSNDIYWLLLTNDGQWSIQLPDTVFATAANAWVSTGGITGPYVPQGTASGTPVLTSVGNLDLAIPTDWHESILVPFAKKWFLSHPLFANSAAAANVMEQYQVARMNLESFSAQIAPMRACYN